ncbi:MAG: hypothetical protein A2Y12_18075 [Planctomycetes bacterium GWF2_42_9]|nr:MAG: hypothetical protein A2Y12_18075 [Planctomycetes bacterium GWF2_42_9]
MKNKTIKWVGMSVVLLLVLQTAIQAAYILPTTNDIWHGYQNYKTGGYNAYIEYAVYKTADNVITVPASATGTYTYAYKIVNKSDSSVIGAFQLYKQTTSGLATLSSLWEGSVSDGSSTSISPDAAFNSGTVIQFDFAGGIFEVSKNSVYLVFTSNYSPVAGSINLTSSSGDEAGVPGGSTDATESDYANQIPEPTTMALLSLGAMALKRNLKRRRS